ncbi:MAG: L-threonylcarbamoyladenylate synthase [Patescibacteria group bacterium]
MKTEISSKIIENAVEGLKKGSVIVYPTETAYALGCDATNAAAVRRVFKIKKRPLGKTLPLIAGSLAMVKRYCRLAGLEQKLAKKHWPGPLTLVLGIRNQESGIREVAKGVVGQDKTVAIRVSGSKIARDLSHQLGRPIISTSANLAGGEECYSLDEVRQSLRLCHSEPSVASPERSEGASEESLLFIDGGRLKKIKPSTIVKIKNEKIEVLRQGAIEL